MSNNRFIYQPVAGLFLIWCLIILVLIQMEFGTDVDSWYLAESARLISDQNIYLASRPPGFPAYELILSILIPLGAYLLSNALSAFFACLLLLTFFLQVKKEQVRLPLITWTCLLFFPLFIVAASTTLDYLPALSLMWISYYLLYAACETKESEHFLYISAILLGVSAGFRLTALGFLLPACYLMYKEGKSLREIRNYCLLLIGSTCMVFLPVLLGPGLKIPLGQSILSIGSHAQVVVYNLIMFWGPIPFGLLLLGSLLLFFTQKKDGFTLRAKLSHSDVFHILVILLYLGLFILLPDESSYLFPLFPSSLILVFKFMKKKVLWLFFAGILLSNLVGVELKGGESGQRVFKPHFVKGVVWKNYEDRKWQIYVRQAVNNSYPVQPTLLMMEIPWVNVPDERWTFDENLGHFKREGSLFFFGPYIFDEKELLAKKKAGYRICVWKEQKWEYFALGLSHLLGNEIEVLSLEEVFSYEPDVK